MSTPPPPHRPRRARTKQQQIWSSGDYNRIAAITVPVSEALVRRADPRPGQRVLDVATGTGHAALAAARRGAHVTGIDYVPALLDIARRRAAAEDLPVDFVEADRGGPPVRRRLVRPRRLGDRRHVRGRPRTGPRPSWSGSPAPADGSRWRAGRPPASSAGCSRPSARTSPAAGRPAADPVGHRGHGARPARRRRRRLTAGRATVPQLFASPEAFADFFLT